jgi:hypothetical protein
VVAHYALDPERILVMPLRLFWVLASNIDRMRAQDQIELLDLMIVAQAGDVKARGDMHQALRERLGTPVRHVKPRSSRTEILSVIQEL